MGRFGFRGADQGTPRRLTTPLMNEGALAMRVGSSQERISCMCGYFNEGRLTVAAPVHTAQHQAVQVDVEVGSRSEALD